jgi:hypothetical protein
VSVPILTPRQTLELLIINDLRNILAAISRTSLERRAMVIADCAARLFQAREVDGQTGGNDLERQAEQNLRDALAGWRDR